MKKLILVLIFVCITSFNITYAISTTDENNTLNIYIKNSTQEPLRFDRVAIRKPGSKYSIHPLVMNPGDSAVVTVEKTTNNDIDGQVIFIDSKGGEVPLFVLDQEQIHFGQPVFSVNNGKYHSILLSLKRNKNVGPRFLTCVEATLKIEKSN